jgi:hypothetical protein
MARAVERTTRIRLYHAETDVVPFLLIGVMTNPSYGGWRNVIRIRMQEQQTRVKGVEFGLRFVMGSLLLCPSKVLIGLNCTENSSYPFSCANVIDEQRQHGDVVALPAARECSRRGQPVAEKACVPVTTFWLMSSLQPQYPRPSPHYAPPDPTHEAGACSLAGLSGTITLQAEREQRGSERWTTTPSPTCDGSRSMCSRCRWCIQTGGLMAASRSRSGGQMRRKCASRVIVLGVPTSNPKPCFGVLIFTCAARVRWCAHDVMPANFVWRCRLALNQLYAYYGMFRWRLWKPGEFRACGHHIMEVAGESVGSRQAYRKAVRFRLLGNRSCVGPFLFADGSFHMMTAALARAVFSGSIAAAFAGRWREEGHKQVS